MKDKMVKLIKDSYWIFLEPTTYCRRDERGWLLYNTCNGKYYVSESKEVTGVISEICDRGSLGVSLIQSDVVNHSLELSAFVDEIEEKKLGGILCVEDVPKKPVRFMPVLNLQRDIDKLKLIDTKSKGREIGKFLLELNIYINNSCNHTCSLCEDYHKQYLSCTAVTNKPEVNIATDMLELTLNQVSNGNLSALNIIGGDLSLHPNVEKIVELLQPFKHIVRIWSNYKNFSSYSVFDGFAYTITVNFPVVESFLRSTIQKQDAADVQFLFHVTSEDDYKKTLDIVNDYPDLNYSVLPVYDGMNMDFFQRSVFVSSNDILEETISLREIFAHQKLNTNFFGSLTVLPNGDVKANINREVLGNVRDKRIVELIHEELLENTAWRRTRDDEPCNQCRFQFLCPSPSNLELVIGRANLCQVVS
ncbi:MAG TPA: TIGR04150 pseudo-rSAM protein [Williamwhitmania sp.]|nr:TIGR04150 pseudo-rSAM protein [Williamwhitmania sp.]